MQDQIASLISLQTYDMAVDEALAATDEIKIKIKAESNALENLKASLKTSKEKLAANQLKKKQLEADVDTKEKLIQKHQSELNSLKSNEAYKSMLQEIQTAKNEIAEVEDKILSVMELMDKEEKEYKEVERKFKTEESVFKGNIQKLESALAEAEVSLKQKKDERESFSASLSADLRGAYEAVREKNGGTAIAEISNHACSGCRMTLPASKEIEVKKAKNIMRCDSCSRILYIPVETETIQASE